MYIGLALPLALAVLVGSWLASWGNAYWAPPALVTALGGAALGVVAWRPRSGWILVIAGLVFVSVQSQRAGTLAAGLSGESLMVDARILAVTPQPRHSRLLLAVEHCQAPAERPGCEHLRKIRVSAYAMPEIRAGERWRMTVRLRPPRGFRNPHTFDYADWLRREGIQATGYLRAEPAPQRLETASFSLRRYALQYLDAQPLPERTRRWLAALTLGESERLNTADWALLNASGTTHLVVVSGLHVGLVAAFVLLLGRGAARMISPLRWRMQAWPWWLAAFAAVSYALLAGMAPPAMRAMVMTLVALWVARGRHAPGPWQGWWLALALVVLVDPLSLWRPGLWLSFLAVAWLIMIWQGRTRPRGLRGWLWGLTRTQLLLAPLMAAAVLLAFARLAPAAPLVNLIAVPWVSMVLVPTALLGWLLMPIPGLGQLCWWLFDQGLSVLISWLSLATYLLPLWVPSHETVTLLAWGLALLALCWGLPGLPSWLRLGVSAALVMLVPLHSPSPWPEGQLRVTVHDVGQGQLIELRSAGYRLLYDTGPRFRSGFMPLTTLWPPGQHFDRVIVSHADNDHAGGVAALSDDHRVADFLAPQGETIDVDADACMRGKAWQRDGVTYRLLWPPRAGNDFSSNDRSCVLEVSVGTHRLLITGDVTASIERRFLLKLGGKVDILLAGHHGSRSSSGVQFVREVSPGHVMFSAGRDNAFQHPVDEVVRRFWHQGSCLWSTAQDGALRVWLGGDEKLEVTPMRDVPGRAGRC
ncbi:DNA internalization-related competence protein ComEC/Rec2 [Halomonas sediminis]